MGEISNTAFIEILSSADFVIISLKHFQFFEITIPGQDKYRPAKIPQNRNKKYFIFRNLTWINNKNKKKKTILEVIS